jgi:hypothetical protein
MTISSPQPSVLHLVTLFRQISSGEIRIPAFQREFVWSEKQILELLESVIQGFPIGSLLLWHVEKKMLRIAPGETTSFPPVEESFPTSYVLDGMQRLSTLYGVFHFGGSTTNPRFDVWYDLEVGQFFHRADREVTPSSVPLAALFTPRQLLEHQARLSTMDQSDRLIERLLFLQASFQEYMVPVVTIRGEDVHRIVGVFERINSTGTPLDPVDFMRAITWAEDFDLNDFLEKTSAEMSEFGFNLEAETIIKCVGLMLGVPPTTDGLLQLRNRSSDELAGAFYNTLVCMRRVATFLLRYLHIRSSDLVSYEGQLLVLFKAVGMEEMDAGDAGHIVRWFWAAGFNESLRGKPDHYVVRGVEDWRGLVRGEIRGLEPRLKLSALDLYERRLVSGRALSNSFAAMHAANQARSLLDGTLIDPATYMTAADMSWFEPAFSRAELIEGGLPHIISARIFGNVVLVGRPDHSRSAGSIRRLILDAKDRGDWNMLRSQFMDDAALAAVENGDPRSFMIERARLMHQKAAELVG